MTNFEKSASCLESPLIEIPSDIIEHASVFRTITTLSTFSEKLTRLRETHLFIFGTLSKKSLHAPP